MGKLYFSHRPISLIRYRYCTHMIPSNLIIIDYGTLYEVGSCLSIIRSGYECNFIRILERIIKWLFGQSLINHRVGGLSAFMHGDCGVPVGWWPLSKIANQRCSTNYFFAPSIHSSTASSWRALKKAKARWEGFSSTKEPGQALDLTSTLWCGKDCLIQECFALTIFLLLNTWKLIITPRLLEGFLLQKIKLTFNKVFLAHLCKILWFGPAAGEQPKGNHFSYNPIQHLAPGWNIIFALAVQVWKHTHPYICTFFIWIYTFWQKETKQSNTCT